jgi:hypothetical protein
MIPKHKKLTEQDAHKLFAKFAAPLFRVAKTPVQQESAQQLTQILWMAFITGSEIETATFEVIKKTPGVGTEGLALIEQRYCQEMKPSITNDELSLLKAYFKV